MTKVSSSITEAKVWLILIGCVGVGMGAFNLVKFGSLESIPIIVFGLCFVIFALLQK